MKIIYEPILQSSYKYKGVTTNGFVTNAGKCVMGRGIAEEVKLSYPGIDRKIGHLVKNIGNSVHFIDLPDGNILVTLPVKPVSIYVNDYKDNIVSHARDRYVPGSKAPGFLSKASIGIVKQTMDELAEIISDNNITDEIIVPRFGCGAGELTWREVQPFAKRILPDNVLVTTFKPNESHKVFVSIGNDVEQLPLAIVRMLEDVFLADIPILIDDTEGSLLVQQMMKEEGYTNVWVYHTSEQPNRLLCNRFHSMRVDSEVRDVLANECTNSIHFRDKLSYEKVSYLGKPSYLHPE